MPPRPARVNGFAPGSLSRAAVSDGSTRTMRSSSRTPAHMFPWRRNATPPNNSFSASPGRPARALRTRAAWGCEYAIGPASACRLKKLEGGVDTSLHRDRRLRGTVPLRRLPELDPVPVRVRDPPELAVWGVLDLRVDLDPFLAEGGKHLLQVPHAIVDHEARPPFPEVRRVSREDRP